MGQRKWRSSVCGRLAEETMKNDRSRLLGLEHSCALVHILFRRKGCPPLFGTPSLAGGDKYDAIALEPLLATYLFCWWEGNARKRTVVEAVPYEDCTLFSRTVQCNG